MSAKFPRIGEQGQIWPEVYLSGALECFVIVASLLLSIFISFYFIIVPSS